MGDENYKEAIAMGKSMVQQGFAKEVRQCRNETRTCTAQLEENSLDFVYVNAQIIQAKSRSEQWSILLETLKNLWPKMRNGGVFAGNNYDGAVATIGKSVKGSVNSFFGGSLPGVTPNDLFHCPRQVTVTYREGGVGTTWLVRK